jgi:Zn-dependent protease with chaperone function
MENAGSSLKSASVLRYLAWLDFIVCILVAVVVLFRAGLQADQAGGWTSDAWGMVLLALAIVAGGAFSSAFFLSISDLAQGVHRIVGLLEKPSEKS